jgi:hypothetical protein
MLALRLLRHSAHHPPMTARNPEHPFAVGPMNGSLHQIEDLGGTQQLRYNRSFLNGEAGD